MALRQLARSQAPRWLQTRGYGAPTVFDRMVQITVTDSAGNRHLLRGKEGDRLIDVLVQHESELGGNDVIGLSPEGMGLREAHVLVPNELLPSIPQPAGDAAAALEQFAPSLTKNSRLASKIRLDKQLNNVTLSLGAIYPWRTV